MDCNCSGISTYCLPVSIEEIESLKHYSYIALRGQKGFAKKDDLVFRFGVCGAPFGQMYYSVFQNERESYFHLPIPGEEIVMKLTAPSAEDLVQRVLTLDVSLLDAQASTLKSFELDTSRSVANPVVGKLYWFRVAEKSKSDQDPFWKCFLECMADTAACLICGDSLKCWMSCAGIQAVRCALKCKIKTRL